MHKVAAIISLALLFTVAACDDSSSNDAPTFAGQAPGTVRIDEDYSFSFSCGDYNGDVVTASVTEDESCGGTVTEEDPGYFTYTFTPAEGTEDSTCVLSVACSDGSLETEYTKDVFITHIPDISELDFHTFSDWAEPIEDFITLSASELGHMNFRKAISELAVFDDNLYIGYGDADYNLGRVAPIEVRYFTSLDASDLHSDFTTDEEEISLYRQCNGNLIIPGVDATEDDLLGNVYTRTASSEWYKSRTLQFAWHVHDAACYQGNIYAVGSGGTIDDYNNSTVNAFLWVSEDGGETFTIDQQIPHPDPPGDHRLTQLAAVGNTLLAFGYYSTSSTSYAIAYSLESDTFAPYTLNNFFMLNTWPLSESRVLATGVNIASPLTFGALYLDAQGSTPVPALEGVTVWDAVPLSEGRALILFTDGDEYPEPTVTSYSTKVGLLSADGQELTLMVHQFFESKPRSLAYWREHLFLGLSDGRLLINESLVK